MIACITGKLFCGITGPGNFSDKGIAMYDSLDRISSPGNNLRPGYNSRKFQWNSFK